jgi:hypothetical protein
VIGAASWEVAPVAFEIVYSEDWVVGRGGTCPIFLRNFWRFPIRLFLEILYNATEHG